MIRRCTTCNCRLGTSNTYHKKQRRCNLCVESSPYDFTFKEGNCTIQIHTELLSDAQLKKIIHELMPARRSRK